MKTRMILVLLMALSFGTAAYAMGDETPAWLKQAAAMQVPVYDKKVNAVVLVNEEQKIVEEDGRMTTITRRVVRILTRAGREEATAQASYTTDTEKIKEMRAWLIRPTGELRRYDKKETLDVTLAENDVYNESRLKVINAKEDAEAGSVFGYEAVKEGRSFFSQFPWRFQTDLPTLSSRFTVAMPEGWRAESITFNHPKIEPVVTGSNYSWELRNLPFIEEEPAAPRLTNIAPRLAVSIYPPQGKSTLLRTFATWKDVAIYDNELSDPQSAYTDAIAAKARELTASRNSEWEKIEAIGRYAQSVNYISIQTGLGRGGGYRPHLAADIFSKNYGDCKDKATLMRSMLKSIGVEAYPVSIYSGDRTYVRAEWPSMLQFNHAIIAVRVSNETKAPAVLDHPSLGRLLIFDPTDNDTPVGDLPDHEQGSLALIAAGERSDLTRMPVTEPDANKMECEIDAVLDAQGALSARLQERLIGQRAVAARRVYKRLAAPDFVKRIEKWVTTTAPLAVMNKVEPVDDQTAGKFQLLVEFKSPTYAQTMRGKLMVFKPSIVSRQDLAPLGDEKRSHPVVLESHAYRETVRIKLPEGFEVDELPDSAELNHPFGQYAAKFEVKEGHLIFQRSLSLKSSTIPVEQYAVVRNFFGRIRAIESAPVVLAKK
jgi:hypothetical protein